MKKLRLVLLALLFTCSIALADEKIAWYASWPDAAAAAKEQGRPILLMSAAVQCHGVSGIF